MRDVVPPTVVGPPRERSSRLAGPRRAQPQASTTNRNGTSSARGSSGARFGARFLGLVVTLGAVGAFGGCGEDFSNCEAHRDCPAGAGGQSSGGSTNTGGTASGGATSGTGGTGGSTNGGGGVSGNASGGAGNGSGGSKSSEVGGAGGNGGAGGAGAETGQAGDGGTAGGSSCDTTASPSETQCWLDDDHAIFVAPSGRDQNAGGRHTPVKTIGKAVELAGTDKPVIACAAVFKEVVTLTTAARIYGGFGCPSGTAPWVYDPTTRTVVQSGTAAPALEVRGAGDAAIVVEDLAFEAGAGATAGESSVAAYVVDSADVTLRRVRLAAGAGANGDSPANEGFEFPAATELVGIDGKATAGGEVKQCVCPNSTSSRGGGGGGPEANGGPGKPPYDATSGLGGDTSKDCGLGGSGLTGASAPAAADARGASTLGILTSSGWMATSGGDAEHGAPGQGGGGGAGKPGGGGGGGGCGGCGGQGGKGGTGGGASIALLSIGSSVVLETCDLTTGDAGKGGNGAAGQDGQQAAGLRGNGFADGCDGGNGGKGSAGGAGGGAAGGISVAVAFQGNPPVRDADTIVTTGSAGLPGEGGNPGENDGIPGISEVEFELP